MSFLETLQQMGLFPGQGQGAAPAAPAAENPYGIDDAALKQARWASLGNISAQLMALGQQMTPAQRAVMLSRADFTGGLQDNLYNAAQMTLMTDARKRKQREDQMAIEAQKNVAELIKNAPPGKERDAAMFFFQAGDYKKAGEILYNTGTKTDLDKKVDMLVQSGVDRNTAIGIATGRFHVTTDPFTNTQRITDLAGGDVGGGGGAPAPAPAAGGGVPSTGGVPPMPPVPGTPPAAPAGPPGGTVTPGQLAQGTIGIDARKAAEKGVVDRNLSLRTNADGALGFLSKVARTEDHLKGMNDSDFGPIQGQGADTWVGTGNLIAKGATDWLWGDNSIGRQDIYRRDMADLELDVSKMKLKGDGPITEGERKIAKDTLGGLTSADKNTAQAALNSTKVEAATKIRDAIQAGVLTEADIRAAGIDPMVVVKILADAGLISQGDAQAAQPQIKIKQIK